MIIVGASALMGLGTSAAKKIANRSNPDGTNTHTPSASGALPGDVYVTLAQGSGMNGTGWSDAGGMGQWRRLTPSDYNTPKTSGSDFTWLLIRSAVGLVNRKGGAAGYSASPINQGGVVKSDKNAGWIYFAQSDPASENGPGGCRMGSYDLVGQCSTYEAGEVAKNMDAYFYSSSAGPYPNNAPIYVNGVSNAYPTYFALCEIIGE